MFEDDFGTTIKSSKYPQKEISKKAPPIVKRFEEDVLDEEDWLLTQGEILKKEAMIQPDEPDRVQKMQEEELK